MPLKNVAILVALTPFLAANLSYLFSAWQGHVDWCIPYAQGCSSISAAGRHGVAYFLFKGLMIPAAVLMAIYWWLNIRWLELMQDNSTRLRRVILILGLLASVGLVVYACALGSIGDVFRTQRRTGVILFFSFTFLAQLLTTSRLAKLCQAEAMAGLRGPYLMQLGICGAMLGVGALHLLAETLVPGFGAIDNIVEWNFALLTALYYFSSYWVWRFRGTSLVLQQGT